MSYCLNSFDNKITVNFFIALLIILYAVILPQSNAATITVNTDIAGSGCTLIDAIDSANANSPLGGCLLTTTGDFGDEGDTILLPIGQDIQTLIAVHNTFLGENGLPAITSRMTIRGEGSSPALIRREPSISPKFRIFQVREGGALTLDNIQVAGGDVEERGGGIVVFGASLTVRNSVITGNFAQNGGGIHNRDGTLLIANSTIADNEAFEEGAGSGGGVGTRAIDSSANTYIVDSTISGNNARIGAGVSINGAESTMTIINSTISDNHASTSGGGGIAINDFTEGMSITVRNTLISGNSNSPIHSGDELHRFGDASTFTIENNLIGHAGLNTTQAVSGVSVSSSNLFATSDGAFSTPLNRIISPLADNGGPTQTHALVEGSPAIDAGIDGFFTGFPFLTFNAGCQDSFLFGAPFYRNDQRGFSRPQGVACDIGSYEGDFSSFFVIPLQNGGTVIFNL